jgi:hypothetical protein
LLRRNDVDAVPALVVAALFLGAVVALVWVSVAREDPKNGSKRGTE